MRYVLVIPIVDEEHRKVVISFIATMTKGVLYRRYPDTVYYRPHSGRVDRWERRSIGTLSEDEEFYVGSLLNLKLVECPVLNDK